VLIIYKAYTFIFSQFHIHIDPFTHFTTQSSFLNPLLITSPLFSLFSVLHRNISYTTRSSPIIEVYVQSFLDFGFSDSLLLRPKVWRKISSVQNSSEVKDLAKVRVVCRGREVRMILWVFLDF